MPSTTTRRRILLAALLAPALFLLSYSLRERDQTVAEPPAATTESQEKAAETRKPVIAAKVMASASSPDASPTMQVTGSDWKKQEAQPALMAFREWSERYAAAPAAERDALVAEGVATAKARREILSGMIRTAPEQALAAAVPMVVRQVLPASILDQLEERVSGQGSISTLSGTPVPGSDQVFAKTRHALIGRSEYVAFTYGRRAQLNDLPEVSINGIALDGALAVSDSPVRLLESGELPQGREVLETCAISGKTTPVQTNGPLNTTTPNAVEVDGKIQMVCQPSHISKLEARLISGESVQANGDAGSSTVTGKPAYAHTHGSKKVLIIRVDFSDVPGTPVNDAGSGNTDVITPDYAVNGFNAAGGMKDYFEQCSYGQTTLSVAPVVAGVSPDVTAVFRMPGTGLSYATGGDPGVGKSDLLHSDARAAATAAGFNMATYDRIIVSFTTLGHLPGSQMTYAGLGATPGKNIWIPGYYKLNVLAHETGHTYGMNHSSSWLVTDGNPVSPTGTLVEYGDKSDIMGDGSLFANQFDHWNKSIVQWLPDAAVTTIASNGTYRVHRFDSPSANLANALALKVVRNRTQDYWIGYRRATANANFNNGAYIVWGANQNTNGLLLDFNTPGTDVDDAPLAVGQTFNDTASGITLTTVARGGSGADEYLDVQVSFQPRIAWTQSTFSADEQSGAATLTLSRSNNTTGAVSVHWATTPGTATSPADFTASSGDVTWANGDGADKTVTIPLVADALVEGTENFTVTLSAPTGGGVVVDSPVATVSIVDPGVKDAGFVAQFINSSVTRTLVQPDGTILIAGPFTALEGSSAHAGIARIKSTGAVDTTFGIAGGAGSGTSVSDLARQPDGKILVCGDFTTMNGVARNRIARLNVDGSLDTSFNPGTGADDKVNAVLVQPNGKVLIGGSFLNFNGTAREYLARLNADGSLDTAFTGPDFADAGGWNVFALALQADGKLIVAGSFYFTSGGASICRVTTTGARDATFNGVVEGAAEFGNTNNLQSIDRIALQLDGKILIAGAFTSYNAIARGGLARLTDTGALDTGFPAASDGFCKTVLVQPDGRILVGGTFTTFNSISSPRLVRLSSAGVVETGFAAAGAPSTEVDALAMQADGKLVLGTAYGAFQGGVGPLYRMFSGLAALPGTIQLSSATAAATEGTNAVLSVSRTGGSSGALSVNYSTVIGTAGAADFTTMSGTLSWANGDSAAKTITVPITTDALTEPAETFTVNLGQPLLGGAILGSTQSAVVTITDPITPYEAWRSLYFTPTELANAAISGSNADPDGDGIANLVEYFSGTLPRSANASPLTITAVTSTTVSLSYRRSTSATDVTYSFEHSDTLISLSWTPLSPTGDVLNSSSGGIEIRTASFPRNPADHDFFRLKVTNP